MTIHERIRAAGLTIPELALPSAAFLPYNLHGNVLIVSGQLPVRDGKITVSGKVPDAVSIEDAKTAARLCVANLLGWASHATQGRLERVARVLKVGGYVATSEGFADAPLIIDAASELITQIFGPDGAHARIAIGVASLPFNAPVEVEASFVLDMPGESA